MKVIHVSLLVKYFTLDNIKTISLKMQVTVVLYLSTIQRTSAYCSSVDYYSALTDFQACPQLNPEDLGSLASLGQVCRTLECSLECLVNAVGDCTNHEYFKVVDMEVFKATFRYACSDPEATVKALEACEAPLLANECVANKNNALYQALLAFTYNSDVDAFINAFCSAMRNYRACAPQPPIQPTATCSADQAAILNNVLDIDSSVSGCNMVHRNELFSVYGGPTRCGEETTTTSSTRVVPVSTSVAAVSTATTRVVPGVSTTASSTCEMNNSLLKFQACPQLDPEDLGTLKDLQSLCRSLECTLKCLNDAAGPCANTGFYQIVDMQMYKTYFRYACSNPEGILRALQDCVDPILSNNCITNKNSALHYALLEFQIQPTNIDGFISDFCRALVDYRRCAPQGPIQPTSKCSAAQATIVNNLLDIDASISGCGQAHANALFSVHGGPIQCQVTTVPTRRTTAFISSTRRIPTTNRFSSDNSSCSMNGKVLAILIGLLLSILVL